MAAVNIVKKKQKVLYLGNLNAVRDWGDARDYVEAMWKILQQKKPGDFLVSTGKGHSVRQFVEKTFNKLGIKIKWRGIGLKEVGINSNNNQIIVKIDKRYFRPNEVNILVGNSLKSQKIIKWKPKISFDQMITDMISYQSKRS